MSMPKLHDSKTVHTCYVLPGYILKVNLQRGNLSVDRVN